MDSRITPANRKLILEIKDNTPVPFSNKDLEWIAENIEDLLQKRFDLIVDNITVEG